MLIVPNNFFQCCETFHRNFVFFSVLEKLQICFTRVAPEDWRYLWNAKHCLGNFLTSAIIRLYTTCTSSDSSILSTIFALRGFPHIMISFIPRSSLMCFNDDFPINNFPLSHFFSKHLIRIGFIGDRSSMKA